jgi:hypothetical protein
LGTFRTFVPPPEVRPDSSPSFLDKFEAAGDEELWQPRPGPVSESRIVSSRSGFAVIPALKISRANPRSPLIGVQALPSDPGKGEHREASSFSREAASWPELLVSEEREDLEDARMLCRELRRLALLEEEQRGIPWSA